jgi:serine/threonine protein kinase
VQVDAAQARLLSRVRPGGLVEAQEPTADTIGHYRLLRRLGRGGMGEVWEAADDKDPTAHVAIKLLRAAVAAHEPTRRRFLREARTAASVRHERIVRIFDVGSTDAGTPFIVMERLLGTPLEALVREHGALPWTAAREILGQVAEGLAFAHSRGVVHRDLKPANVMVSGGVEAPRCTIIDFGLARREVITSGSESLSMTGEVFGSPPFMSPEQFKGETADARSDIYSFGCLMFFVLTGRRPFEGEKLGDLMYKHLFEPAPTPVVQRCPPGLAPALVAITLRALRKAPEQRFANTDELIAALHRVDVDPTPIAVPEESSLPPTADAPKVGRRMLPWLIAVAAVGVGVFATVRRTSLGVAVRPGVVFTPHAPAAAMSAPVPATAPAAVATPGPAGPSEPDPARQVEAPEVAAAEPAASGKPPRSRRGARSSPAAAPPPAPSPSASPSASPNPTTSELPPNPFRSPPPNAPGPTP